MPELSPTLSLPYLQPAQAQKHVTHNEALRILDAVTQLSVMSVTLSDPPAGPNNGDRYLVAGPATGDWTGQEDAIAVWAENAWTFFAPGVGWRIDVAPTGQSLRFDGLGWVAPAASDLQNVALVGVNTSADATNRLAVSSDATLLNNAGAGHQLKLNKSTAGDTASLLFQTGFSGRAEMGTAGSDGFSIKVSADGSTFENALVVDEATGMTTAKKRYFSAGLISDQTGVLDQTQTTVFFDTAPHNDASMFNVGTGQLTPPSGAVSAVAGVQATGLTASSVCSISIWKNGAVFAQRRYFASGSGVISMEIALHDVCSGSDTYEARVYINTASTGTLDSTASYTYFRGFHH
jgi:hypothetical protein